MHICIYIHIYIHVCIYTCMYMYINIYIYIHTPIYIYIHTYIYIYMYLSIYISIYIYLYICISRTGIRRHRRAQRQRRRAHVPLAARERGRHQDRRTQHHGRRAHGHVALAEAAGLPGQRPTSPCSSPGGGPRGIPGEFGARWHSSREERRGDGRVCLVAREAVREATGLATAD